MSFKSVAEFEDPKNAPTPTTAEKALIAAARAGKPCRLWTGEKPHRPTAPSDATRIRASLLRLLILGDSPACGLHESGVWLEGAWIDDPLDLAYCTARGATVLDHCHFTDTPNLTQTTLPQLSLDYSALPGLFAQGAQIAGDLFLREVSVTGTVYIAGAKIGGQLSCTGATLNGGTDKGGATQQALNAQGVEVGESLFLTSATVTGTVDVNGAKIGGQVNCEGATLNGGQGNGGATQKALNAQRMRVTEGFLFRKVAKVQGGINLTAAHVGDLVDDSDSWPDTPNTVTLDGFTYDRIAGGGPTTFAARRR
jgi:hypothetical protein